MTTFLSTSWPSDGAKKQIGWPSSKAIETLMGTGLLKRKTLTVNVHDETAAHFSSQDR